MATSDAAKLTELLAELDRLCVEATKIREKIAGLTHQQPIWPERREFSRLLQDPAQAHDLRTRGPSDCKN